jgi:hypothetical protein
MLTNVHGTNSITIPVDVDMEDGSLSPLSASSFHFSSSIESSTSGFNHFSQSVPNNHYHQHHGQQQRTIHQSPPPSMGLFPQLGSTLPNSQQQPSYLAPTPSESTRPPTGMNSGSLSFEDLLHMYYNNGNSAAVSAVAVAGTPSTISNGFSSSSNTKNNNIEQTCINMPSDQGNIKHDLSKYMWFLNPNI